MGSICTHYLSFEIFFIKIGAPGATPRVISGKGSITVIDASNNNICCRNWSARPVKYHDYTEDWREVEKYIFSRAGHSAGITASHRPDFGNQVTAAGNLNVLNKGNHKVDVNAFTTKNFPIGPTPNYSVHGAGVNYQYKDIAQVGASVARTPIAQRTDYSISSGLKLHQTPTSSFSANIGASKFDAPYSKGNWTPNAFFHYQKKF
ncbi:Defense protein 3 [Papilio machaon]|uniref:Defense protein 3 n=1 Tax=Papilio machaon TaxID=76193 RepID=A0A0N1IFZ4_PAPMA|nr:Defense protein 3 [Papilio machaon]